MASRTGLRPQRRTRPRATLWGGAFEGATDPRVEKFTRSLAVDRRLYLYDIRGSIAHTRSLVRARILTAREGARIIDGLGHVQQEIESGRFTYLPSDEDIHSAIERRLTERIGRLGQKLHTGRSRNDQVMLDVRLYLRDEIDATRAGIAAVQQELLKHAERLFGHLMPGYTHLQRAQPVLISHHLLAYHDMLERDAARLADCRVRVDVCPLGSGALAGAGFPIDRRYVAKQLGFTGISTNSIDAVADRDFIAEFLAAAAILAVHLSRLGEEIVLWASTEFGFVIVDDAIATGSSMMPQKRNPDVGELLRGKSARTIGNLTTILTLLKGLPFAYNRDLQEDKEPLFDTAATIHAALDVTCALLTHVTWNTKAMHTAASDDGLLATDLADALVERGLEFRAAHEIVGRLVAAAQKGGYSLRATPPETLRKHSRLLDEQLLRRLTPEASVRRRRVIGGTAPAEVRRRLKELRRPRRRVRRK